jgi:hypothetical protein
MVSVLAASASATWTINVKGDGGYTEIQVSGGEPLVDGAICWALIDSVKYTFDIPNQECDANSDDPDASGDCDSCVGVSWNSDPTSWKDENFCYDESKTYELDLSDVAWDPDSGKGLTWLKLQGASWVKGNDAKITFEILGKDGKALAKGASCEDEECEGSKNCGPTAASPSDDPTANNSNAASDAAKGSKVDTGVGSVLALGGVAIMAAAAVVVSRKRK